MKGRGKKIPHVLYQNANKNIISSVKSTFATQRS